ncbi:MAG: hypothetical protein HC843_04430 [Sphingomonadales bacterium]|nr:hypothetical protein [Sphingomonadales bacterium]
MNHRQNEHNPHSLFLGNPNNKYNILFQNHITGILLFTGIILISAPIAIFDILANHNIGLNKQTINVLEIIGFGIGFASIIVAMAIKAEGNELAEHGRAPSSTIGTEANLHGDEIASLQEIDKLILSQDPYFALQLAYSMLKRARAFPIRVQDIQEWRAVLEEKETERTPSPQVSHLSKLIKTLEHENDV